ncbi:Uncharacterised protein [Vibrio cholerae]|uniref:hypothetical protein n=1 Tax=Vibrio cholerae TaxID=666 RepID=UPI000662F675|nr:hypothetical protein [Vibrio cholerae]OEC26697.1 hypothetical protein BFX10_00485 [Vibrio cholerae]OFI97852.1 hypothetical protein BFX21_00485 [Vibrio cholerae]CSC04206.1 Uncharacterised protein [Vibrio cholerae]CSE11715.1 Uncharacterised protein [Vibrio cholerae]
MAKRLCKLSRHEIATSLSEIERLVAEPQFLCRACARVAGDKKSLCKPQAMSLPAPEPTVVTLPPHESGVVSLLPKASLKKQRKFHKKLEKVLKKQRKLMKKQQLLEGKVGQRHPTPVVERATAQSMH